MAETTIRPEAGAGVGATARLLPGSDDNRGVLEITMGDLSEVSDDKIATVTFAETYSPDSPLGTLITPANADGTKAIWFAESSTGGESFLILNAGNEHEDDHPDNKNKNGDIIRFNYFVNL